MGIKSLVRFEISYNLLNEKTSQIYVYDVFSSYLLIYKVS